MTVLTHSPLGVHDRKDISSGPISLVDEDQGIVEAIVSVTNVLDDVNDIILPGAYKATLVNRVPKGVWCADEATEILTTRGWLRYDELTTDDEAYVLDVDRLTARFEPVLAVNVFPAEKRLVRRVETGTFSSVTTMGHRWPVRLRTSGNKFTFQWRTTDKLGQGHGIFRTLPREDAPEVQKYSDAFVEVVGWGWTEGCFSKNGNSGTPRLSISQSLTKNPIKCASIRSALDRAFPGGWFEKHRKNDGGAEFCLLKEPTLAVAAVMGEGKAPTADFLTSLTVAQLRLLVDTCIDGDGHREASGTVRWFQKSQSGIDAFEMACALAGISTNSRLNKNFGNRYGDPVSSVTLLHRRFAKPFDAVAMAQVVSRTRRRPMASDEITEHDGIVWCPTTASGTWLARREGTVYFTGNSHSWEEPIAKTLEAEELMPGDPRLPASIQALGGGGLLVRAQFNMATQRGRDAFADVKFFGDHSEWSIGYVVPAGASTIDQKTGIRKIKSLELFEYSPVLFGANAHTVTMSVKNAIGSHKTDTSDNPWDDSEQKASLVEDVGASVYRRVSAWVDPKADADAKTAYKFLHHFVTESGEVGAASTKACSAGIDMLHDGAQGATIPDVDRLGVYQHLAAHLKDAGMEPPDFKEWEAGLEKEKSMDPETEHLFVGFHRVPDLCSSCGHGRDEEFHLGVEDVLDDEIKAAVEEKPYEIRKDGDQYCVVNQDTGAKVPGGCHESRSDAVDHMRALYANVPDADKGKDAGDEEGPHDYVPSKEGDDNSPCEVCGLPMDASIHDESKALEEETPMGDKGDDKIAVIENTDAVVSVEEEKALVEPAEESQVEAASEDDEAEEKATGATDTLPDDVVRAIQDLDTILDALMTKYGVDDQDEPDADDSVDASKVFRLPDGVELNLAIDPEATDLVIRRAASGQIYIEGRKGEEKTDPFFPHVFESGGEAGMCALCGFAKDANIHIPFPIGEQDPLNPRQPAPGSARLPDNPTAGGPLDPVKPTPGSARNPDNPTPGGPLDAPLPAKTAEDETAIKVGTIEANKVTVGTLDAGEPTDTKVNVPLVGSFEDLQNQIQASLGSNLPTPVQDGDEQCAWVEATFPDSVLVAVVEYSTGADNDDDDGTDVDGDWEMEFIGLRYFRYPYTAAEGALSLGSPEEVDVRGVIAPKAAEPEGLINKTVAAIEAKAGRTLSGSNADKIRQAVQTLIEVLSVAGVDVSSEKDAEDLEVEEKAGIPAHLLMQNDLLRMLADR